MSESEGTYCDVFIPKDNLIALLSDIKKSTNDGFYNDIDKIFVFPFTFRSNESDYKITISEFIKTPERFVSIVDLKIIESEFAKQIYDDKFIGSYRGCQIFRGKVWFHTITDPQSKYVKLRITAFKIDEEW